MKYLKLYEMYYAKNPPKIGDYVICQEESVDIIENFLSNNIGRIVSNDFKLSASAVCDYLVEFKNAKIDNIEDINTIKSSFNFDHRYNNFNRPFNRTEIEFYSKNKKDCEKYLLAKKFNL